jgi:hypothetical protein
LEEDFHRKSKKNIDLQKLLQNPKENVVKMLSFAVTAEKKPIIPLYIV